MIYKKPKQIENSELNFLKAFLASDFFDKINNNQNCQFSLVQEPYTGFGYADLVCIIWHKSIRENWSNKRNQLDSTDIKILHHLYNVRIFDEISKIVNDLGFNLNKVNRSIEKLFEANLIKANGNRVKIRPINDIFFVKEIISIEAKLRDWKRALEQSVNNIYFSSESYTLFPEKIINKRLLEKYKYTDVGIISFKKTYSVIKKPKKQSIPPTLNSWFFNEYIGREVWVTV